MENPVLTERAPLVSHPIPLAYGLGTILLLIGSFIWYIHNNYSFVYDNNYMNACEANGATSAVCSCSLDIFKHTYSYRTAKDIEVSGHIPQAFQDIVKKCL